MSAPAIKAVKQTIAPDVEFGPGVVIEADEVVIGAGARIGFSGVDDFRTPPGVLIRVKRFEAGPGVTIGRGVLIEGGGFLLGERVAIRRQATIKVLDRLEIGAYSTLHEQVEVAGRSVRIGQEGWILPQAKIGGGSCFEVTSRLDAGHYFHLGVRGLVNTSCAVTLGNEIGLGTGTCIYTHGAYPSILRGAPAAFLDVSIGDRSWLPGAIVNPGVKIGSDCVIGVNSLVTKDVPSGSLAAGSPAKVLKEGAYPARLSPEQLRATYLAFLGRYATVLQGSTPQEEKGPVRWSHSGVEYLFVAEAGEVKSGDGRRMIIGPGVAAIDPLPGVTLFDTTLSRIRGIADAQATHLVNELRRHGVRFYSRPAGTTFADWA